MPCASLSEKTDFSVYLRDSRMGHVHESIDAKASGSARRLPCGTLKSEKLDPCLAYDLCRVRAPELKLYYQWSYVRTWHHVSFFRSASRPYFPSASMEKHPLFYIQSILEQASLALTSSNINIRHRSHEVWGRFSSQDQRSLF